MKIKDKKELRKLAGKIDNIFSGMNKKVCSNCHFYGEEGRER